MRIAIVGTGGIGAPLGASLATAGQDVIFLARGAHLAAMHANGLRVEGDRGETVVRPVQATDRQHFPSLHT
jgi:2-dehydropantoate 2-reductase